jgi:hypothetical protein
MTIAAQSIATPALVYVRTNGCVSPQVWHEPMTDIGGYWAGRIVAAYPLPGRYAGLPFDILSQFCPPPAAIEELSC